MNDRVEVKNITVPKTARYFHLPVPDGVNKRATLLAFHGYRQLGSSFIRRFYGLDEEGIEVLVPEGLHGFYVRGTDGKVEEAKAEEERLRKEQVEAAKQRIAEMKAEKEKAAKDRIATEEKAKKGAEIATAEDAKKNDDDDVVVFRNILFDFDKSDLRPLSEEELNKVYNYLMSNPGKTLQLDGHADWIGTVEYNLALSERRAKQAYEYLVKKGLDEGRMVYQYYGEAVPVAPNGSDNPEGRQLNRRCEFNIKTEGTAEIIMKF